MELKVNYLYKTNDNNKTVILFTHKGTDDVFNMECVVVYSIESGDIGTTNRWKEKIDDDELFELGSVDECPEYFL